MATDPLPARQRWADARTLQPAEISSIPTPLLRKADPIAFLGGKLAAALMPALRPAKFKAVAAEQRHPLLGDLPPEEAEYEAFGNGNGEVHSARAFRQLIERAARTFSPQEDRWHEDGRVVDPFRPDLRYAALSEQEFDVLQDRHLNVVRTAFRRAKTVLVALSTSEVWEAQADGAVFPHWETGAERRFDAERHAVRTLTVEETVADLDAAVAALRGLNPGLEIVLMVSPEPQPATALPVHVLAAAALGKAVLRAAMETVCQAEGVHYFPALEISSQHLGLGGYPPDGTVPREIVSAIATALIAISEGGKTSFERSAAPISAAPPGQAAPALAPGPAPDPSPETQSAAPPPPRKAARAAKPKTVAVTAIDPYSQYKAEEDARKAKLRAEKRQGTEAEAAAEAEEKRAQRQAEREAKRQEAIVARDAKRAEAADQKRAAAAEAKAARGAKRAENGGGVDPKAGAEDAGVVKRTRRKAAFGSPETSAHEAAGAATADATPTREERRAARVARRSATSAPAPAVKETGSETKPRGGRNARNKATGTAPGDTVGGRGRKRRNKPVES